MVEFASIDKSQLIEYVRDRPCIWKRIDKNYSNKEAKNQAWQEIAEALGEGVSVDFCKKTWKLLRDILGQNVRRMYWQRKKSAANGVPIRPPKWVYWKQMKFIDEEDVQPNPHVLSSDVFEEEDTSDDLSEHMPENLGGIKIKTEDSFGEVSSFLDAVALKASATPKRRKTGQRSGAAKLSSPCKKLAIANDPVPAEGSLVSQMIDPFALLVHEKLQKIHADLLDDTEEEILQVLYTKIRQSREIQRD